MDDKEKKGDREETSKDNKILLTEDETEKAAGGVNGLNTRKSVKIRVPERPD